MPTPFMSLPIPQVLTTKGPDYATQIDQSLTLLDGHDHTVGKGRPIPLSAINVNADFSLAGFNLAQLRAARLQNLPSSLTLPLDVTSLYAVSGDLFYNNAANVPVQVTAGNSINVSSVSGIGGDYATSSATVTYSAPATAYSFFSGPSVYASMVQGLTTITAPASASLTLTTALETIVLTAATAGFTLTDNTNSRPLLAYQLGGGTGAPGVLTLGSTNATAALPTLIGALPAYAVADARAPAQVTTHGTGTEAYVSANKDGVLGLGLGYINGTVGSAGTIGGTAGVLRMFTSDSMFFATQATVAGVMDNAGNWGFSPGHLTVLNPAVRVHVYGSTTQDTLMLDMPAGDASAVAFATEGAIGWRIFSQRSAPLFIQDFSGANQAVVVPGPVLIGGQTTINAQLLLNDIAHFVNDVTVNGTLTATANANVNGTLTANFLTSTRAATLNGGLAVNGSALFNSPSTAQSDFSVFGTSYLFGPAVASNTFTTNGTLAVNGPFVAPALSFRTSVPMGIFPINSPNYNPGDTIYSLSYEVLGLGQGLVPYNESAKYGTPFNGSLMALYVILDFGSSQGFDLVFRIWDRNNVITYTNIRHFTNVARNARLTLSFNKGDHPVDAGGHMDVAVRITSGTPSMQGTAVAWIETTP